MEDAIPQGVPGDLQTGHESTAIQSRGLFISAGVLIGIIIVCQVVLGLWMRDFGRKDERAEALFPGRSAIEVHQFPQPRLQESPTIDMVELLREERARITTYGWIDREAGIARIPVARAMDILAERGLPKVRARPRMPGAPPNTTIPPARKREEAGPEEGRPRADKKKTDERRPEAEEKKADGPRPEPKQGGKP